MKAGDLVTWLHEPRGGYGYTFRIPARVVKLTARRVVIDAQLASGGTRRIAVRAERIEAAALAAGEETP